MIKSNMNKINIDELINVDEYIVNKDTNLFEKSLQYNTLTELIHYTK